MISAAPVISRAVERDAARDGFVGVASSGVALADPAEQEHLVVHGEPEEDREEEERDPRLDHVHLLEAEQVGAHTVLEDEHEEPVGGADREEVEQDRWSRRRRSSERRS